MPEEGVKEIQISTGNPLFLSRTFSAGGCNRVNWSELISFAAVDPSWAMHVPAHPRKEPTPNLVLRPLQQATERLRVGGTCRLILSEKYIMISGAHCYQCLRLSSASRPKSNRHHLLNHAQYLRHLRPECKWKVCPIASPKSSASGRPIWNA